MCLYIELIPTCARSAAARVKVLGATLVPELRNPVCLACLLSLLFPRLVCPCSTHYRANPASYQRAWLLPVARSLSGIIYEDRPRFSKTNKKKSLACIQKETQGRNKCEQYLIGADQHSWPQDRQLADSTAICTFADLGSSGGLLWVWFFSLDIAALITSVLLQPRSCIIYVGKGRQDDLVI